MSQSCLFQFSHGFSSITFHSQTLKPKKSFNETCSQFGMGYFMQKSHAKLVNINCMKYHEVLIDQVNWINHIISHLDFSQGLEYIECEKSNTQKKKEKKRSNGEILVHQANWLYSCHYQQWGNFCLYHFHTLTLERG